jgi:hypothetical protein
MTRSRGGTWWQSLLRVKVLQPEPALHGELEATVAPITDHRKGTQIFGYCGVIAGGRRGRPGQRWASVENIIRSGGAEMRDHVIDVSGVGVKAGAK